MRLYRVGSHTIYLPSRKVMGMMAGLILLIYLVLPGTQEVSQVNFTEGGSGGVSYIGAVDRFQIFDPACTTYTVWYKVNGAGAFPGPNTIEVDITVGDSASAIAVNTATQINAALGTPFIATLTNPISITNSSAGSATDIANVNMSIFVSFTTPTQGNGAINLCTDQITINNHGFTTNWQVRVTTTGTLPSPLVVNQTYFVIRIDANTIQLSATKNGPAINLTTSGTGTMTVKTYP